MVSFWQLCLWYLGNLLDKHNKIHNNFNYILCPPELLAPSMKMSKERNQVQRKWYFVLSKVFSSFFFYKTQGLPPVQFWAQVAVHVQFLCTFSPCLFGILWGLRFPPTSQNMLLGGFVTLNCEWVCEYVLPLGQFMPYVQCSQIVSRSTLTLTRIRFPMKQWCKIISLFTINILERIMTLSLFWYCLTRLEIL